MICYKQRVSIYITASDRRALLICFRRIYGVIDQWLPCAVLLFIDPIMLTKAMRSEVWDLARVHFIRAWNSPGNLRG